jgi:esterase/lipase superfamily enzyme
MMPVRTNTHALALGARIHFTRETHNGTLPTMRRNSGLALCLLAIIAVGGCASPYAFEPFAPRVAPALGELRDGHAAIKLFYATDRRLTDAENPALRFGIERTRQLKLGHGEVTIPQSHGRGRLETPGPLESPSPQRHVMLFSLEPPAAPDAEFWNELHQAIEKSPRKEVLVFVHGFFSDFGGAACRAAQIAHDTAFDGPVIVYSWSSQAYFWGYLSDTSNVEWTEPYLIRFLETLSRESGAEHIHLMAHSMGTRALARAVRDVVRGRGRAARQTAEFDQIVLAASDFDAEIFARDYAPPLTRAANRVTIYVSNNDWALLGAQRLHGYKRLGQYWPSEEQELDGASLEKIDLIDVTAHDKGMFGHIYYGESPRVLDDLHGIFAGKSAAERGLRHDGEHFVLDANVPPLFPTSAPASASSK